MRYLDQMAKMTQRAVEDVCRTALALPEDKGDWSPGGDARSALNQMQEIAMQGAWFLTIIREGNMPAFGGKAMKEVDRIGVTHGTLPACVEKAKETTAQLCQAIIEFPLDRLDDEVVLPFGGGIAMTMADVIALPYWNMIYHLGQINQIQLMLGDREMH